MAVSGNQLQFRDQAGRLSIETILDRRADGLVTETARSFAVPTGTRWDYSIVSGAEIRMRELATGQVTTLARCPDGPAPAPAPASPRPSDIELPPVRP